MATNTPTDAYDVDSMSHMSPMQHVRHRISMYLGDNTGPGGMSVGLREIIDNSQDEFLNGHGNVIKVSFFADGSAEVQDSGRGVPTGISRKTGDNGIILAFANIGAGGKFNTSGNNGYAGGSGGLNGVGAAATQAVSERFDVTVYRDKKEHKLSFSKGEPGFFAKENDPKSKFTPSKDLKIGPDKRSPAEKKARPTGTTIRVWPDPDIFVPGAEYDVEGIKFRLKSTAFLLPGLRIEVNDMRDPENPVEDVYDFDGGVKDMIETVAPDQPLFAEPVYFQTKSSFTETATILDTNGKMTTGEVERPVDIDVAFSYGTGYETTMKSFVNIINTKNGGKHEDGFYQAMRRVWVNQIKNTRGMLKAKEEAPTLDDVKEGLTAIVSIKFPEPQFVGQEKATLGTSAIAGVLSAAVGEQLEAFIANKRNAATVKLIMTKIVEASRARLASREQKLLARKKSSLETATSMPTKLVPCSSSDPELTELQLCEGISALGGLRTSRSAAFQAIYPLRGKPLNTYNMNLVDILKNQEISDMVQIIGAGVGRDFDLSQMRYKRIIILADADPDGGHIAVLLAVFFWKFMRPLIEDGRLYVAMPPLFSITTMGKNKDRFYALNEDELDKLQVKLKAQGKKYEKIQRHKGLGEYDKEVLAEVVMDPRSRTLKQITMDDVEVIAQMMELTMGKNAAARQTWIVENRELIDDLELDIA